MKIRILGNSLRLRLNVPEVESIERTGFVSDGISFGETELIYCVKLNKEGRFCADLSGNTITVYVPENTGKEWATSDLVSLEITQEVDDGKQLKILVEKDFACLMPRENEDESKLFANPKAGDSRTE